MIIAFPQGVPLDVVCRQAVAHHQAQRLQGGLSDFIALYCKFNPVIPILIWVRRQVQPWQDTAGLSYPKAAIASEPIHSTIFCLNIIIQINRGISI